MVEELTQVRKKYAQPRKTEIIYSHEVEEVSGGGAGGGLSCHRVPVP
ncbi:MAG: hypothetical protein ACLU38_00020 [Dysosmobacter sp.]